MSETVEELEQIIEYLTTSSTVWRNVDPTTLYFAFTVGILTYDNNWPLVTSTFFYGVRANTSPRLYMWGVIGNLTSYKRQPMYTGAATTLDLNFQLVAAASSAARAEVFPAAAGVVGLYAPNTEEFLSRGAVHDPLQNIQHLSAHRVESVIVCDSSGRLYVRGDAGIEQFPSTTGNLLGLGPHRASPESGVIQNLNMASPTKQYALQRVYGDDPAFSAVKFVQVHTGGTARRLQALDDEGHLWFAGDATAVTNSDEFPDDPNSSRNFQYFRKHVVTTWINTNGVQQSGELLFKSVSAGSSRLVAVTKDGRLFVVGTNVRGFGSFTTTARYRQVGGFIDTIVPKFGDDGAVPVINLNTTGVSISIAAPTAGGTQATATPIMRSIGVNQWVLFGVRIDNPGSGYSSPPLVTFRYGVNQRTDLVSCTVFSGTWESAELREDHYAAITSDGVLYLWGDNAYNNAITNSAYGTVTNTLNANSRTFNAPIRAVQFQQFGQDVPQQPSAYVKVSIRAGQFGGVAIGSDGALTYWGPANRTPNGTLTRDLTVLPGSTYIDCDVSGAESFAVIDSENDVYTYGLISAALARGSNFSSSLGIANYQSIGKIVGSAKWSRVYGIQGGGFGFYAVRLPEQLDEFRVRKNPLPPFGS